MKQCTYCGAELQDEARACNNCGRPVPGMPEPEQERPEQSVKTGDLDESASDKQDADFMQHTQPELQNQESQADQPQQDWQGKQPQDMWGWQQNQPGQQNPWGAQNQPGQQNPWGAQNQPEQQSLWGQQDPNSQQSPWGAQNQPGQQSPWGAQNQTGQQNPWEAQNQPGQQSLWGAHNQTGQHNPWGWQQNRPMNPYYGGQYPGNGMPQSGQLQRYNVFAMWSLILGVAAAFLNGFVFIPSVLAIVFGIIGIVQIKRDPAAFKGIWMAVAGLVLSVIFIIFYGYVFHIAIQIAQDPNKLQQLQDYMREIGMGAG